MQVIGRKGGDNPGVLRSVREGHNALSACGNAVGDMMPPFFTFTGVRPDRRLTKGSKKSVFNLTRNGWPSETSWFLFCQEFVKFKDSLGLGKTLLIVDGAKTHMHLPTILLLIQNNVRLLCLPSGVTGKMQPLDVGFFGPLSHVMRTLIHDFHGDCKTADLAKLVDTAYKRLEFKADCREKPVLSGAFAKSGLVPFNPEVFLGKDFARSDHLLGLSASHLKVLQAKELRAEAFNVVIDSALAASCPDVRTRLEDHVKATGFDMSGIGLTDDVVVKRMLDRIDEEDLQQFLKEVRKDESRRKKEAAATTKLAKQAAKGISSAKPTPATSAGSKRSRAATLLPISSSGVQRPGKRQCVPKIYSDFE
jgi:hypothetical protein